MELRDYLKILRRHVMVFGGLTLIITGLFAYFGFRPPVSYDAVSSVSFVKAPESPKTGLEDFKYENFYALTSSQLLVNIAIGWLAEPGVAADIYQAARVELPAQTISRYGRLLKTKDLKGTSLLITTNGVSASEAEALASQATNFLSERVSNLIARGELEKVVVLVSDPLSQPHGYNPWLVTLIGLITGVVLGALAVFSWEYLKQE